MTDRRQTEKDCQSAYFDIDEDLPECRGYRLQERIRRKISPIDTSTNDLLILQHYVEQEFFPLADIIMTQYKMKQVLKRFGQNGFSTFEK